MNDGATQEFAARNARRTKRCVAFIHSTLYEELWTPCTRRALTGGHLCRAHRDALDGAMYGLGQAGEVDAPRYGENPTIEEALIAFAQELLAAWELEPAPDLFAPAQNDPAPRKIAAAAEEEKSAAPIVAAPAHGIG